MGTFASFVKGLVMDTSNAQNTESLRRIALRTYGERSDTEALTDCYVTFYGKVLILSLVGNDSSVNALSAAIKDKSKNAYGLYAGERDSHSGDYVSRAPKTHYKEFTAKLAQGVTHKLLMDTRFFEPEDDKSGKKDSGPDAHVRLVFVRLGEDIASVVYAQVLRNIPTPMLPEWSGPVCEALRIRDKLKVYDGFNGTVVTLDITEKDLDLIVSSLVKAGVISWEH
jgi:hypothetical protein